MSYDFTGCYQNIGGVLKPVWDDPCEEGETLTGCIAVVGGLKLPALPDGIGDNCSGPLYGCDKVVGGKLVPTIQFSEYDSLEELEDGCCEPEYQYGECDHACYLDPSPDAWSSSTTYDLYDCVTYSGTTYYSTIANNLNNTPGANGQWEAYSHCGNTNWNSISGYGGINRTPLYYSVSFEYLLQTEHVTEWFRATGKLAKCCGEFCVAEWVTSTADWEYYYYHSLFPPATSDSGSNGQIRLTLGCTSTPTDGEIEVYAYDTWRSLTIDPCELSGSGSGACGSGTCSAQWRPTDCAYTLWDSSTTYLIGDCIAWKGSYYICNTPHSNQEPPNASYWTLVS